MAVTVTILGVVASFELATESYTSGLELAFVAAALLFVREIENDRLELETPPMPFPKESPEPGEKTVAPPNEPEPLSDARSTGAKESRPTSQTVLGSSCRRTSLALLSELHPTTQGLDDRLKLRTLAMVAGLLVALGVISAIVLVNRFVADERNDRTNLQPNAGTGREAG